MPVLAGTTIAGLVDPGRQGEVLVAKQVTLLRPAAVGDVARALVEAASWVDCTTVDVARVEPASARSALEGHVADLLGGA